MTRRLGAQELADCDELIAGRLQMTLHDVGQPKIPMKSNQNWPPYFAHAIGNPYFVSQRFTRFEYQSCDAFCFLMFICWRMSIYWDNLFIIDDIYW